jgi:hypothetical protein
MLKFGSWGYFSEHLISHQPSSDTFVLGLVFGFHNPEDLLKLGSSMMLKAKVQFFVSSPVTYALS